MSVHFSLCNGTVGAIVITSVRMYIFGHLDLLSCKRFPRNYRALDTHEKHIKHYIVISWHATDKIIFLNLPSNFNIPVCPVYL